MYDTTKLSLEMWMKHEFEHLGWMVLAKEKSMDESRSEQERNLMKNKVNVYCESLTGLKIALEQKVATLDQPCDKSDKEDLLAVHRSVKILIKFVDANLMKSSQLGGAKRRSKRRTSKKTSRK
jgi:hypothetical protein